MFKISDFSRDDIVKVRIANRYLAKRGLEPFSIGNAGHSSNVKKITRAFRIVRGLRTWRDPLVVSKEREQLTDAQLIEVNWERVTRQVRQKVRADKQAAYDAAVREKNRFAVERVRAVGDFLAAFNDFAAEKSIILP